jgi:hypothetical protein
MVGTRLFTARWALGDGLPIFCIAGASPPELDTFLTSAKAGTVAIRDKKTANIMRHTRIPLTN